MAKRMTDRNAIYLALHLAMEWEDSVIDSYGTNPIPEDQAVVDRCRRNMVAFKRVLDRYYGGPAPDPVKNVKPISLMEVLGRPPQQFVAPTARKRVSPKAG